MDIFIDLSFDQSEYLTWFKVYFGDYIKIPSQVDNEIKYKLFFITDGENWDKIKILYNTEVKSKVYDGMEIMYLEPTYESSKLMEHYCYFIQGEFDKAKYCSVRIVRDMLIEIYIKDYNNLYHMAAVEKNGSAITLMGNKFNGKTTSLINLLCYGSYNYLSNDKLLINNNNMCIALPYSIGVRCGTLNSDPFVASLFSKKINQMQHYQPLYHENERIFIMPNELCSLFNKKIVTNAKLVVCIKCVYDSDISSIRVRKLEMNEKLLFIKSNLLNGLQWNEQQYIHVDTYEITYNETLKSDFVLAVDELYEKFKIN